MGPATSTNQLARSAASIFRRINIPVTSSSPPGLIAASQQDPWRSAGRYSLGWVYFCIILLVATVAVRIYHMWTDIIRKALSTEKASSASEYEHGLSNLHTEAKYYLSSSEISGRHKTQSSVSSIGALNRTISFSRWIFYRPLPVFRVWNHHIALPSLAVTALVAAALIFVPLYCFLPRPLYYASIAFGSPPLAIRAGMIAIAMVPWIIGLSMKANLISFITGIGHERLNVLHRWGGYLCLFLSLVHTIPFYIQPVWDQGGMAVWGSFFKGTVIYGSGWAALAPLLFLCIFSHPFFRSRLYELFVILHVPVAILFLGMLFWHCANYLTSWRYLFATLAIWLLSYALRVVLYLNWTKPRRLSWLIGEECVVTILPENALKVIIPTEMRWKPGQYVYLRMPGISIFENHPFTIASLCSDDFPSEYGPQFRDMVLVFRPFGGFTRKVLDAALAKGPYKTYRAFLDGPYGGMQRQLASFNHVVLIAGGSGITTIISHLLHLIKLMRDGKAVTKTVEIIWAMKRPDVLQWFQHELKICREHAPPGSVRCQFFITAAKRQGPEPSARSSQRLSGVFYDRIGEALEGVANKRNSALIRDEPTYDLMQEKASHHVGQPSLSYLQPSDPPPHPSYNLQIPAPTHHRPGRNLNTHNLQITPPPPPPPARNSRSLDFGFPTTPTMLEKNLMRFAFLPAATAAGSRRKDGWTTEYGRPDISYLLRESARDFGRRTCVFVCGPPSMRIDVASTVARLQQDVVWKSADRDEIYLHAENYAV
ncbi:metalloreductase-like protein transmembrane component [Xylona heveae TC161]|uniref:ferric-chelate reductase (NADPH) n=1 Tax=Xylona heveae (strain CBS 132557 / TC161) TaxID=1328760 RepID=A0A165FFD2_XYLHT|nr:metalloreductase-like protein transmembrane component [Xylona heveae TC161]KZF20912.1 metalloreductase-like protein transmembrane component [Xylona heveae TC161]